MRKEIDRVLGNSLRCILPSFWWKRLLGMLADKVDSAQDAAGKALTMATMAALEAEDKQSQLVSGSNIKTINHQSILGSGNLDVAEEPIIFILFADTEEGKALNAKAYQQYIDDNSECPNVAINAIFGCPTVVTSMRPISNASEHQYITLIWCDFGGNIRETHIHSDGSVSLVEESGLCTIYAPSRSFENDFPQDLIEKNRQTYAIYRSRVDWPTYDPVRTVVYIYNGGSGKDYYLTRHDASMLYVSGDFDTGFFLTAGFYDPNEDYEGNPSNVYCTVNVKEDGTATVDMLYFDSELSDTSTNAVQNKVVTAAINNKADKSDIKTLNGVSLLGGGNLQLGDGQTFVYDDTELMEVAKDAKADALEAKALVRFIENEMDALAERVAELERIIQQQ